MRIAAVYCILVFTRTGHWRRALGPLSTWMRDSGCDHRCSLCRYVLVAPRNVTSADYSSDACKVITILPKTNFGDRP